MTRYILGRLASVIFVLFAVSVFTFSLMRAVPGGPFDEGKQRLPETPWQFGLMRRAVEMNCLNGAAQRIAEFFSQAGFADAGFAKQ